MSMRRAAALSGRVSVFAVRADHAHESLREHRVDRARDEIRRDVEVEQTRERRRRVVGVQRRQHEVSRERRLGGDLRRLGVADFADENDVGILSQQRAQRAGERHADFLVHRHLRHAGELVLDRIFDREDFLTPGADHLDRRVERRRLAGARRTGDEHDAVRPRYDFGEQLQRVGGHAQLEQRDAAALLVEQTQHDALAAQRRHRRHAHVDLAILQPQPNAAVLRQPALGDVELRHDLETADDRGGEMRRRRRRVLQHAVDAIAHAQSVLIALEVHVRRARVERLDEQQVHEAHDRRFVREVQQVVERNLVRVDRARLARSSPRSCPRRSRPPARTRGESPCADRAR